MTFKIFKTSQSSTVQVFVTRFQSFCMRLYMVYTAWVSVFTSHKRFFRFINTTYIFFRPQRCNAFFLAYVSRIFTAQNEIFFSILISTYKTGPSVLNVLFNFIYSLDALHPFFSLSRTRVSLWYPPSNDRIMRAKKNQLKNVWKLLVDLAETTPPCAYGQRADGTGAWSKPGKCMLGKGFSSKFSNKHRKCQPAHLLF